MDFAGLVLLSLAVGLIVGILSGLLGIGGGTLMVPIFRLGYGTTAIVSTASSLFTIIPTAISGSITHIRGKTCLPALGVAAGIGGAFASPVGVWLADHSPGWLIMVAAAAVIAYSAATMLIKGLRMKPSGSPPDAKGAAAKPTDDGIVRPSIGAKELVIGALIGLGAGVASGYVGVGGGFIMVPLMVSWLGAPMRLVSGTSLIAIMILAVPGVIYQAILGHIYWTGSIALAVGTVPGALIGARLARRVPERALRLMFGGLLIVVAAVLVINQFVLGG